MKGFIKVMKAFPDPNRVKVPKMLQNKSIPVQLLQQWLECALRYPSYSCWEKSV